MIREFSYWWRCQMVSLVPPVLLASLTRLETRAVLRAVSLGEFGTIALVLLRGALGHEAACGQFAIDPAGLAKLRRNLEGEALETVILEIPRDQVLEKRLNLARALLPYLPAALEPEIEHETPYLPGEVFWYAERVGISTGPDLEAVDLRLVGREAVAPLLEALAAAGIPVTTLEIAPTATQTAGPRATIPLPRSASRPLAVPPRLRRRVGAFAALALLALAIPFLRQTLEAERTEARIESLAADVDAVQSLRQQLNGTSVTSPNRIVPITLLAAITEILPDDTELTSLAVERREVSVTGRSSAANALLPRFVAAGYRDAGFSAPVVRDSVGDRDVFSIHFSLTGER